MTSNISARRAHRARWYVVLLAMSAAVLVWTVAVPGLGLELAVDTGGHVHQVGQLSVTMTSLIAGMVAAGSLSVCESLGPRFTRWWRPVGLTVLLLSLLGVTAAQSASTAAVLATLHLLVGGILLVGLPLAGRSAAASACCP